jgi:uncharacterized protein (TIGR00661 family)
MIYVIAEGLGFGHISRVVCLVRELEKRGIATKCFSYGKGIDLIDKEIKFEPLPFEFKAPREEIDGNEDNLLKYVKRISVNELKEFSKEIKRDDLSAIIIDGSVVALFVCALNYSGPIYFITNDLGFSVFPEYSLVRKFIKSLPKFVVHRCKEVIIPDFPIPISISEKNNKPILSSLTKEEMKKIVHVGPLVDFASLSNSSSSPHLFLSNAPDFEYTCKVLDSIKFPYISFSSARSVDREQHLHALLKSNVIIHHGGHTTIMESIVAGKPQIIIYDSNYPERANNAKKVQELGLGIAIDKDELNALTLEEAVYEAFKTRKKVQEFMCLARKMDGVREIVKRIGNL